MANGTGGARRGNGGGSQVMEPEVLQANAGGILEQQTRGEIDIQIATALRFPRSIKDFQSKAMTMATMDEETAASCFYVLPARRGSEKSIEGPSARLAEIIGSAWRHMRIVGRVVEEGDRFLTLFGGAWDLESNVARAVEVRRRITGNFGRYNDDMIAVTANAGISIATRNAVFQVIPKAYWWPIYLKCREVAVGNAQTLASRRAGMLAWFQKLGVQPERVFALLEVRGQEDITLDHLATLKGLATAIKEGDTTIDDAFASVAPAAGTKPPEGDPLAEQLAAIPEAERRGIETAFDALGMNRANRLVQLRAFKGQPEKLLEVLRGMLEAGKGEDGRMDAEAAVAGEPPATSSPDRAGSVPAPSQASAPAATTTAKPRGRFDF